MINYYEKKEEWKSEVGNALAGLIRSVASIVPIMLTVLIVGLFLNSVLSAPFQFSCKSETPPPVKHKALTGRTVPLGVQSKSLQNELDNNSISLPIELSQ